MSFRRKAVLIGVAGGSFIILGIALLIRMGSQSRDQPLRSRISGSESIRKSSPSELDLLDLIDLRKHAVQGRWRFDGQSLVSPPEAFARVEFPFTPPEEYRLKIVVERLEGSNSFNLGLVVGGAQFMLVLDGWTNGEWSGLELIDHKPFFSNETSRKGRLLEVGSQHTLLLQVQRDHMVALLDRTTLVDWSLRPDALSLNSEWKVTRSNALFIGSWSSGFRISEAILTRK